MQTHNLKQGEKDWHDFRLNHFGASEAAAMLGISPHITRTDLLEFKKTGKIKEHNDFTKKIFQKGHEAEELARQILYDQGLDFYPVTCSLGRLSASCDGLTLDKSLAFEHKLYTDDLAEKVFELKIGQWSGPYSDTNKYVFLKCTDLKPSLTKSFEESKEEIEKNLSSLEWYKIRDEVVISLKEEIECKVFLKKLYEIKI